jgi:hypothetical protein
MDGDREGTYFFDDLWLIQDGEIDNRSRNIHVPIAFYDWYLQSLSNYQNWQIDEVRKYFDGQLDVVYAGKGLLPKHVTAALTNDLLGDGWSEGSRALYGGAIYDRHTANLSSSNGIALYLTGIEDPPEDEINDQSLYPSDWSSARWMAHLAGIHGLSVWGENSGRNDHYEMNRAALRMFANNFEGLMWGFESELYADPNPNNYATIDDYQEIISFYTNIKPHYLPIILSR